MMAVWPWHLCRSFCSSQGNSLLSINTDSFCHPDVFCFTGKKFRALRKALPGLFLNEKSNYVDFLFEYNTCALPLWILIITWEYYLRLIRPTLSVLVYLERVHHFSILSCLIIVVILVPIGQTVAAKVPDHAIVLLNRSMTANTITKNWQLPN